MTHSDSCILAIDAGGTSLKAALAPEPSAVGEPETALMRRTFFSVDVASGGNRDQILSAYRALGQRAAALAEELGLSISRIAMCTPGPFDYSEGCSLMTHKYHAVRGIPLAPLLCEGIGRRCPAVFLHDSTAFLLGASPGLPTVRKHICGVTIGTGLGFACMRGERVLQAPSGGPALSVYARPYLDGSSEDYVSKRGILKRYRQEVRADLRSSPDPVSESTSESASRPAPALTVAEIAALARKGSPAARKVFADTGFHLGRILLPLLREYGFDTVILGGAISKSADLFLPRLADVIASVGAAAQPAADIDLAPLVGAVRYRPGLVESVPAGDLKRGGKQ